MGVLHQRQRPNSSLLVDNATALASGYGPGRMCIKCEAPQVVDFPHPAMYGYCAVMSEGNRLEAPDMSYGQGIVHYCSRISTTVAVHCTRTPGRRLMMVQKELPLCWSRCGQIGYCNTRHCTVVRCSALEEFQPVCERVSRGYSRLHMVHA